MKDDTVVALRQPESFSDDPLTEILRAGARQLLGQAIEAEVAAHIEAHADLTEASGRRRIVRPRAHAGTRGSDRDRGCDGEAAKSAGPRSAGHGRAHPFHVIDPAALSQARQVGRGASALALSEGHLQRRLFGGPGGAAGTGRAGPDGQHHWPAESGLVGTNTKPGKSATFGLGATSIFGPTGSTSRLAWTMTNSVFW